MFILGKGKKRCSFKKNDLTTQLNVTVHRSQTTIKKTIPFSLNQLKMYVFASIEESEQQSQYNLVCVND